MKTLAVAAAVTVLLAASAACAAPATAEPTALAWGPCPGGNADPRQRCATLDVPLDHDIPTGEHIGLAVSRIPAANPAARHGTLVLVPGGPGEPGLDDPSDAASRLPQEILDAYDIVGFDPRGVARSAPVSCGLATEDLSLVKLRSWPAANGDIAENAAFAERTADACAEHGGPLLAEISTANEARDIDLIRAALGKDQVSLWGVSYGTYAGAVYAQLFPGRTDRVLLDSVDDPDPQRVARGWLANYAVGVEDAFPAFARWAADPGNPERLADIPEAVRKRFLDLAERLDRDPLPWPGAKPPELSGNVLRQALLDGLYAPDRYPTVAGLIRTARDVADGRPGAALPPARTPPDEVMQNSAAAVAATICNDVAWPTDIAAYQRAVAESRQRHPLTAGMPVNVTLCAFWDRRSAEEPVRIGDDGPENVLLVQNLRDPATPHSGALAMRDALGDRARMVTVDATGHGSYVKTGNACGDGLVTGFLLTGDRPDEDVFCPAA
ncbi:alpha/beta hydrolase [Pseudonocardia sp. DLS-67]